MSKVQIHSRRSLFHRLAIIFALMLFAYDFYLNTAYLITHYLSSDTWKDFFWSTRVSYRSYNVFISIMLNYVLYLFALLLVVYPAFFESLLPIQTYSKQERKKKEVEIIAIGLVLLGTTIILPLFSRLIIFIST